MGKTPGSDQREEWSKKKKAKMYYQKQWKQDRGGRGGGRGGNRGGRGGSSSYGQGGSSRGGGGGREKLSIGMKGFLCSCNFNEKDCVKEAYNLLNEYFNEEEDVILSQAKTEDSKDSPSESTGDTSVEPKVEEEESDEDDIEKAINAEVKQLKTYENKYKFKCVDTEVPNLVFISTTLENPAKLTYRILRDLHTKKEQKSKFLLRMVPIDAICRANMEDVETTFRKLVPQYFPAGQMNSFQIVFKSRYNNGISREEIIKLVAQLVVEENPLSVVDLTKAQSSIIIEVIKNKVCFGLAKDFGLLKKYNLIEVATVPATAQASSSAASAVDPTTASASADQVKIDLTNPICDTEVVPPESSKDP